MKRAFMKAGTGIALLALLCAPVCLAQEEAAQAKVDEKAKEVLQNVSGFYKGLEAVRVQTQWKQEIKAGEIEESAESSQTVSMERPNKLAIENEAGEEQPTVHATGDSVFVYVPEAKIYSKQESPDKLSDVLEMDEVRVPASSGLMFLGALLQDDPYKELTDGPKEITHAAEEEVDGKKADKLVVSDGSTQWHLWFQQGDQPFLLKASPDLGDQKEQIAEQTGVEPSEVTLDLALRYDNWEANPTLENEVFAFSPPEEAEEVDSLLAQGQQQPEPMELGQKAPAFNLPMLDGGQLELSKHLGEEVIILDFWAQWCGPCRQAMPIIAKVADEYKDKNVTLYAVNLGDEEAQIKEFLEQTELTDIKVALDKNNEAAQEYNVSSIPQTVLIGKDGTVQAVHVGLLPNLEQQLKDELDKLVAGESLAQ